MPAKQALGAKENRPKGSKRCKFSFYNKVALTNTCEVNCTKCNGFRIGCIDRARVEGKPNDQDT